MFPVLSAFLHRKGAGCDVCRPFLRAVLQWGYAASGVLVAPSGYSWPGKQHWPLCRAETHHDHRGRVCTKLRWEGTEDSATGNPKHPWIDLFGIRCTVPATVSPKGPCRAGETTEGGAPRW